MPYMELKIINESIMFTANIYENNTSQKECHKNTCNVSAIINNSLLRAIVLQISKAETFQRFNKQDSKMKSDGMGSITTIK